MNFHGELNSVIVIALLLLADEPESCSTDLVKATLKFIKQLMNGESRSNSCHKLKDHEWISLQDSFVPPHALRHLIMLMEVTEEQIERWNTDADEFVKKEEAQKLYTEGIRKTAQDIIVSMKSVLESYNIMQIIEILYRKLSEVRTDWWRVI